MAALKCNTVTLTYRRLADLPILKFPSRSLIPRAVAVVEGPRVEADKTEAGMGFLGEGSDLERLHNRYTAL